MGIEAAAVGRPAAGSTRGRGARGLWQPTGTGPARWQLRSSSSLRSRAAGPTPPSRRPQQAAHRQRHQARRALVGRLQTTAAVAGRAARAAPRCPVSSVETDRVGGAPLVLLLEVQQRSVDRVLPVVAGVKLGMMI